MTASQTREEIRVLGLLRWLYLGRVYQFQMRASHYFGWHYAPASRMDDGSTLYWCHWCGMRMVTRPERVISVEMDSIKENADPDSPCEDS